MKLSGFKSAFSISVTAFAHRNSSNRRVHSFSKALIESPCEVGEGGASERLCAKPGVKKCDIRFFMSHEVPHMSAPISCGRYECESVGLLLWLLLLSLGLFGDMNVVLYGCGESLELCSLMRDMRESVRHSGLIGFGEEALDSPSCLLEFNGSCWVILFDRGLFTEYF